MDVSDLKSYAQLDTYCKATECGMGDKLFASVLIGDLQEAAEHGSGNIGYGTEFLKTQNICWIILRMKLSFDRLPSWEEHFKVQTWATGIDRISYGRDFRIVDSEGNVIGRSTSTWILADWNTHRPVIARKRPELPVYDPEPALKVYGYDCPKLDFPDRSSFTGCEPTIIKFADFSELDRNRHVNNSRYTAWAYDAVFKSGVDINIIKGLTINYNSEVHAGEKVELYVVSRQGYASVYGYKNNDVKVFCVEMELNDV
ncbi:MAG: thioesterase [Saccharofermentans sp.]|jgi:acyl-ACP thioesterase|nr:thioesterase [Mageeibacillus sp.]MCI1264057.1 thioesterase [Saccharofermentans sp.]MCI1274920.1 thioesterase [Saccharofermentans sp.]MCI2044017.1 thioesterase [Mageeibacillus sp.]